MRISTKGRYAIRMMLDLAEHQEEGFVSLKEIAQRQDISKKYLEQIVALLNHENMLVTNRGAQGGYRLAQKPSSYTLRRILTMTEGSLAPVACLDYSPAGCEHRTECPTLPVWKGLNRVINEYLENVTLQDILDQSRNLGVDNYVI